LNGLARPSRTGCSLVVCFWHRAVKAEGMGLGFSSCPVVRRAALLPILAALAVALSGTEVKAQTEVKVVDGGVPTLHVYTNLIQIPMLVLGQNREPVRKPIEASRFSVSIDSGPWFRATHVRQEGEDPISLSILLDLNGSTTQLVPKIGAALASLAPLSLNSRDRVSVYALDCGLVKSMEDASADSGTLKKALDAAVAPWMLRKSEKHPKSCDQDAHLWDALAQVVARMMNAPGRRVILAVTDGQDKGSKYPSNEVTNFAQQTGTAVFGLSYAAEPADAGAWALGRRGGGSYRPSGAMTSVADTQFPSLCELSGGIVTTVSERKSLQQTLKDFVGMVRQRYIVEFPRPSNSTPGSHGMEVKIAKGDYLIRAAGVSMPVPDASLMKDPATIQSGPSQAPLEGTKRVSAKPQ
jgi:hypothetical protein